MKVDGQDSECGICQLNVSMPGEGKIIWEDEHWMVYQVEPAPLVGWLMFHSQVRAHRGSDHTGHVGAFLLRTWHPVGRCKRLTVLGLGFPAPPA
jgi:hypothetical protein